MLPRVVVVGLRIGLEYICCRSPSGLVHHLVLLFADGFSRNDRVANGGEEDE